MKERPLRVLLIVNHYPPDVNPSGRLMSQLAAGLRERGLSIDVLTTVPHYEGFRTDPAYRGRVAVRETASGDHILRVAVFASGNKQNMRHRLLNYLSFGAAATLAGLLWRRRYDIVLASSGSFFTGVSAWILRLVRRARFVYNVQDIYPDVPVRAGQLTNPAAIRGLEMIERFMYKRAAHVTVVSAEQRRILLEKGVPPGKLTVIPNFVDTEFIRPLPRANAFRSRHGLADKFVIVYAGNLGFAYEFDTLIETAARLRGIEDVVFVIVGDGVLREPVSRALAARGLANVLCLPFQPEADLPELRAAADVHVVPYRRGAAQTSMPSKLYEIMASERPAVVAAEAGTDAHQLVTDHACGLTVEPEHEAQLRSALLALYNDRALAMRLGVAGRKAAERMFTRDVAADRYAALLRSLAGS